MPDFHPVIRDGQAYKEEIGVGQREHEERDCSIVLHFRDIEKGDSGVRKPLDMPLSIHNKCLFLQPPGVPQIQ